ncbi:peptidylprolyl isomerase [Desulfonispora thiosulfatigenes DSM 11270]|uniref:Peptidyl-prolyl cis-trans isomerase n=1 Tax=Desulfonispora thiosulfatigenes DSM 11270 TaxID=656914 RepID=A0A1W1VPG0_DESTI|nr:peptidylprolyl isomerase [Desulfonispora thiosulfatigenes]SMB95265.1 peptidylprolyl isomerase [Desulfonispora thiosulfatigenes DSM 11270]
MLKICNKRFLVVMMAILGMMLLVTGCNNEDTSENPNAGINSESYHPKVEIVMKDGGKMIFELYPEIAPVTVENFVTLSKSGFYDGLKFHRIIKDFMIQGGDPKGDGTGGSEKNIKGEFSKNGFKENNLKHTKGVISMARSNDMNSASSQFFIMHGDVNSLDGEYAAFGKLIEGEETLDKLAGLPVKKSSYSGEVSVPVEDVVIEKVMVVEDEK